MAIGCTVVTRVHRTLLSEVASRWAHPGCASRIVSLSGITRVLSCFSCLDGVTISRERAGVEITVSITASATAGYST
jgi:hypothetical protein